MGLDQIIPVLFGAGGAGALGGLLTIINSYRKGRLDSQKTLIGRLNEDSRQQGKRADDAEVQLAQQRRDYEKEMAALRRERDLARDRAVTMRRLLIDAGFQNVPNLDELYG